MRTSVDTAVGSGLALPVRLGKAAPPQWNERVVRFTLSTLWATT